MRLYSNDELDKIQNVNNTPFSDFVTLKMTKSQHEKLINQAKLANELLADALFLTQILPISQSNIYQKKEMEIRHKIQAIAKAAQTAEGRV